jgi:hypothetical protein
LDRNAGCKNVDATGSAEKPNENNKSESLPPIAPGSSDDELIKQGIEATKKPAKAH